MTVRKLFVCTFALIAVIVIASTPLLAAPARLTDQEVKALLESIENKRSAFEAALDDKLKNSIIKSDRGEVNANEFFDDFQDQVHRARDRFESDYSASSEVLSLLQFAARIQTWAGTQPPGFKGSKEWAGVATDLQRLAMAYNTGQAGLANITQARRINDAELVTAVANVEKGIDAFRKAYDSALTANAKLTPEMRQTALQQVDAMRNNAKALNAALGNKQKGVPEADALLKGSGVVVTTAAKAPASSVKAAWSPLGDELRKVALAYEVAPLQGL